MEDGRRETEEIAHNIEKLFRRIKQRILYKMHKLKQNNFAVQARQSEQLENCRAVNTPDENKQNFTELYRTVQSPRAVGVM